MQLGSVYKFASSPSQFILAKMLKLYKQPIDRIRRIIGYKPIVQPPQYKSQTSHHFIPHTLFAQRASFCPPGICILHCSVHPQSRRVDWPNQRIKCTTMATVPYYAVSQRPVCELPEIDATHQLLQRIHFISIMIMEG